MTNLAKLCWAAFAVATAWPIGVDAAPRSAIPWLSESVRAGSEPPPMRKTPDQNATFGTGSITVKPLGPVSQDSVGLLPPETTGFSADLWGSAQAEDVVEAISGHQNGGVPASKELFKRLLLAEANAPRGEGLDSSVLVARVDQLLSAGDLEAADALLMRASPDSPELFRRWFDVGLLTNTSDAPCDALSQNPNLSPTLSARVFCLARGGDWNAAEITLTLGQEVGSIDPARQEMLAWFLDPDLFEGSPDPAVPEPFTPIDFLIREAVGLPRPAFALPLAFLHYDIDEHAPMRTRIEAAERLVLAGSITQDGLFSAYRAGYPAASGSIWDRAAAVQSLDEALSSGNLVEIMEALTRADQLLATRGLRTAFAYQYRDQLIGLLNKNLDDHPKDTLIELLFLAGEGDKAARLIADLESPKHKDLLAISGIATRFAQPSDQLYRAALEGLNHGSLLSNPAPATGAEYVDLPEGMQILAALDLLSNKRDVDPRAFSEALHLLKSTGQESMARKIAIQTLLEMPDTQQ